MKIQLDIPEKLNKKLKHYKIDNDNKTLADCIIKVLDKFFEDKYNGK